jgi:hypothetical protein
MQSQASGLGVDHTSQQPQHNKFGRLKYKPRKYERAKKNDHLEVEKKKLHGYHFL